MNHRALVIVSSFALLSLPLSARPQDGSVARPEIKVGDSWTYHQHRVDGQHHEHNNVYELKVTFVGPKAVKAVSLMLNGDEVDTTWTPEWNVVTDGRAGSFFPDTGLLKFPLAIGATYNSHYEVVRPRQGQFDSKNSLKLTVLGWEEVTVRAGTFRALKVEGKGTYERLDKNKGGAGSMHYVIWYVPELRRWAKMVYESTDRKGNAGGGFSEELLKFQLQ